MTSQEKVWTYFVEANPIPDVDEDLAVLNGGASYLRTLRQGSLESSLSHPSPPSGASRRPSVVWLLAGAIAILALVATWALSVDSQPEPASPESVIEQFITATDYDTFAATLTQEALFSYRDVGRASPDRADEGIIADILASDEILGVEVVLLGCDYRGNDTYRCATSYTSHATIALGEPPIEKAYQFVVKDGVIVLTPNNFDPGPHDGTVVPFRIFARDTGLERALLDECPISNDIQPACAQFIMEHLDQWAAWAAEQPAKREGEGCTWLCSFSASQ